ncbi:MAG TPA: hypothetical protein PK558_04140, partial [Anaerolineaceae bacterium]|nr:hypothetical protein [Anaerolineaceae bacterium]
LHLGPVDRTVELADVNSAYRKIIVFQTHIAPPVQVTRSFRHLVSGGILAISVPVHPGAQLKGTGKVGRGLAFFV